MKFILTLLLLLLSSNSYSKLEPSNWINDYANLLTTEQVSNLNSKISKFEKQTDIEIAFAIVNSLKGSDIESYSNKLFKEWGIGKSDRNNGLLVVIAPNERKWRIEIGYGLEPYLTDYESSTLGENNFNPNFKKGDYYNGINSFIDSSIKLLGKSTWQDRVVYNKRIEKENSEAMANFWQGVLNFLMILACIIVFVILYIKVRKANIKRKELLLYKSDLIKKYKIDLELTNDQLDKLGRDKVKLNTSVISDINNSDNKSSALKYYNVAISELKNANSIIKLICSIKSKLTTLKTKYDNLISEETKLNITLTNKKQFNLDVKSDTSTLNTLHRGLENEIENLDLKLGKISNFKSLIELKYTIDNNTINDINKKYLNKFYKVDDDIIKSHYLNLKDIIDTFESIDKTYDNYELLKKTSTRYKNAKYDLDRYLLEVDKLNSNLDIMVNELNNYKSCFSLYSQKLDRYNKSTYVSNKTKSLITNMLFVISKFKPNSDINSSHENFNNIKLNCDNIIKKAKYEIEEEEENIKRKKRREEEENRRRSSSSYSSGYGSSNWGSSSSSGDSDWGGFGGGDSGGGGSSGSW